MVIGKKYLQDINVIYSNDSNVFPKNRVEEINGGSLNINEVFGGSFVWLVPIWTENPVDINLYLLIILNKPG